MSGVIHQSIESFNIPAPGAFELLKYWFMGGGGVVIEASNWSAHK